MDPVPVPAEAPRRMWTLFEPVHAVTYFAPQARAAFEAAGLRGFWRGYFAGRSAPLGPTGPGPVYATFFGFQPAMVARALPDVWQRAAPGEVLQARLHGARAALGDLDADPDALVRAATLARRATEGLDPAGRTLAAANLDLPWPADPAGTLWQASTILREHRGDGHVAALLTAGLDGVGAVVWRAARDGTRAVLQPARGWTDEQWAAATGRLAAQGWLDAAGAVTGTARDAYAEVERITDELATAPWRRLGTTERAELAALLTPLAHAVRRRYLPDANPIGLPPLPGTAA